MTNNPSQPSLEKGRRIVAFTLAEVLITLGIIAVVAALTMPSLIQNHKRTQVETQLKYTCSLIAQAFSATEVEHANISMWINHNGTTIVSESRKALTTAYFEKYLKPCLKFGTNNKNEYSDVYMHIDINGLKRPNIPAKDIFVLQLDLSEGMLVFLGHPTETYESVKTKCYSGHYSYCGDFVFRNNWKIPEDCTYGKNI